ncbi:MAG: glucose-6-phosphate dehydrogenase, partial [Acidimicrobiales bacterium]
RLAVDSWRWADVPFVLRAGKALAATATEALVEFRAPPRLLFAEPDYVPHANLIRFRLGSNDGVSIHMLAKEPGPRMIGREVELEVDFAAAFGRRQDAYERLLDDALDGLPMRFAGAETIEQQWRIVSEVLHPGVSPLYRYSAGTWGPEQAARLLPGHGWHEPLSK